MESVDGLGRVRGWPRTVIYRGKNALLATFLKMGRKTGPSRVLIHVRLAEPWACKYMIIKVPPAPWTAVNHGLEIGLANTTIRKIPLTPWAVLKKP